MKRILKFSWWFVLFTMLQIVSQSFGLKKVSPTERLSTFIGQSTRIQFFFVVISYILFEILTASLTLIFASDQVWVWPDTKWYNNFKQWSRDLRFRCMITKYFRSLVYDTDLLVLEHYMLFCTFSPFHFYFSI